jgi:hypothetical protein
MVFYGAAGGSSQLKYHSQLKYRTETHAVHPVLMRMGRVFLLSLLISLH